MCYEESISYNELSLTVTDSCDRVALAKEVFIMERKLGINAECLKGVSELDALPLIKAAGFETFFTGAYRNDGSVSKIRERADKLGLTYEFIHAPFAGINEMWMPGLGYLTMFNAMKESIDSAAENGIPIVITRDKIVGRNTLLLSDVKIK